MKLHSSKWLGIVVLCGSLGLHAAAAAAKGDPDNRSAQAQAQSYQTTAQTQAVSAMNGSLSAADDQGLHHRQANYDNSLLSALTTPFGLAKSNQDQTDAANGADSADAPARMTSATFKARDASAFSQEGRASWYGHDFHGRRTADGERFDMNALTAAHRTLPLGSYLRVTNQTNGKSVIVKVNDRGPFAHNRVLDLSYAAAKVIGVVRACISRVKIQGLTAQEARDARAETLASDSSNAPAPK